jgi:hypothetical protein
MPSDVIGPCEDCEESMRKTRDTGQQNVLPGMLER